MTDFLNTESEFNQASLHIWRLHEITVRLNKSLYSGNYEEFHAALMVYYTEAVQNLKKDERTEFKERIQKAHTTYNNGNAPLDDYVDAYTYLRDIMNSRGLLTARKQDLKGTTGRMS